MSLCVRRMLMVGLVAQALCAGVTEAQQSLALGKPRFIATWVALGQPDDASEAAVLQRRVSLDLSDVPLGDVLRDIASKARLDLSYNKLVLPEGRRISVHAQGITVVAALTEVLLNSGLDVVVGRAGQLGLVRQAPRAAADTGSIRGRVTDAETGEAIGNATVTLEGSSRVTTSDEEGHYQFLQVVAGNRTVGVRYIGYLPGRSDVKVVSGETGTLNFALTKGVPHLEDLIATATGVQRRYELGNAITSINVDSLMQTQPIHSVTDLLETRVPGLVVTHTTGAPGDPARLRLRGASSITRGNDPIVIVDGVRIYAAQSDARAGNLASIVPADGRLLTGQSQTPAPSPLDQLDPHSIDRIEVFKGPSAATMYGADAANGVIVVTTKQGRAGPARWTMSATYSPSFMPGKYPDAYFRWGHLAATDELARCPLYGYGCVVDSIVTYQALNNPDLTVLGRGNREDLSIGVSGGSSAITYSLTGSFANELGLLKLPDREGRRLEASGATVPDWMRRPHHLDEWHATGRVAFALGRTADLSFVSTLSKTLQDRSSLDEQIAELIGVYADTLGNLYYSGFGSEGVVQPRGRLLTDMYRQTTADALNFTDAAHVNWRPLGWLTATADLGINAISRRDEMTQPRRSPSDAQYSGDIFDGRDPQGVGFFNSGTGSSLVSTVNLGAIAVAPLGRDLRLRTAFGGNFTRTSTHDLLATGSDLSAGATDLTGARTIITTERRSEITTVGWYIEPTLEHRRFYLSTGLRLDGADTYGSQQSLAGFPKVSLSYLLSDEPFFPFKGLFSTLRLRAAYGQAGVQPGPADRLRLYTTTPRRLGGQTVDAHQLSTIGNDHLKPERSDEFEGGLDADLFGQALTLELTAYRKTRTDALIPFTLPMSVNGGGTVLVNIGKVRNTGFEIGLGTQLLRSDLVTIGTQMHLSRNENLVLSTGDAGTIINSDGTRVAAGYPLFGQWDKPILHYADANSDGIISPDEVQIGDEAVFLGPIEPNYEAALHTNVSLYRGTITLSASFSYTDGQLQINRTAEHNQFISRAANDPTAPLGEQAAIAAMNLTEYGLAQELSSFRFNAFAMAFNAPPALAGRLFGARTASLTLQGTNLGLWSNYRGKDPSVNAYSTGNAVADNGQLPLPRTWAVGIRLGY